MIADTDHWPSAYGADEPEASTDRLANAWEKAESHHPAVEAWLGGDYWPLAIMDTASRGHALQAAGHTPDALDRWARQLGYSGGIEDMAERQAAPAEVIEGARR